MKKLRPLDDRVVIRAAESADKSPGGIVLPDMAKERPTRGEVLAVGPGRLLDNGARAEMSVKPGDVVVFPMYSGSDVEMDGEELKILKEGEIFAVIE